MGKLTHEALYVHASALARVPAVLRVYEGCGRALTGTVEEGTIIKLNRQKPQVSYLSYPAFDADPHPALATVVIARLGKLDVTFRDFRDSANPPILHRKETFVAEDCPKRLTFERLTAQEERAGILSVPNIGMRDGWSAVLAAARDHAGTSAREDRGRHGAHGEVDALVERARNVHPIAVFISGVGATADS